jgi:hypothetical protein
LVDGLDWKIARLALNFKNRSIKKPHQTDEVLFFLILTLFFLLLGAGFVNKQQQKDQHQL